MSSVHPYSDTEISPNSPNDTIARQPYRTMMDERRRTEGPVLRSGKSRKNSSRHNEEIGDIDSLAFPREGSSLVEAVKRR